MAEEKKSTSTTSIGSTFLKCAGEGAMETLTMGVDSIAGTIGNLTGTTDKNPLLSGTFLKDLTENKYDLIVGLDKKGMSQSEKLACEVGNLAGTTASFMIPGAGALKLVKTSERASKAVKVAGATLLASQGINMAFDITR